MPLLNPKAAIAGCHCWVPSLGAIAGLPLLGAIVGCRCWAPLDAMLGCHCWDAIAGCHCWAAMVGMPLLGAGMPLLGAIAGVLGAGCHWRGAFGGGAIAGVP